MTAPLSAVALVCSLKKSPTPDDEVPEVIAKTTAAAARNAAHPAKVLRDGQYPPYQ